MSTCTLFSLPTFLTPQDKRTQLKKQITNHIATLELASKKSNTTPTSGTCEQSFFNTVLPASRLRDKIKTLKAVQQQLTASSKSGAAQEEGATAAAPIKAIDNNNLNPVIDRLNQGLADPLLLAELNNALVHRTRHRFNPTDCKTKELILKALTLLSSPQKSIQSRHSEPGLAQEKKETQQRRGSIP